MLIKRAALGNLKAIFHCTHWHRFFPLKKAFSKTYPSFLTLKEGSTFLTKPLFPQEREDVTALLGARNRYALRLADHQRSSPCYAGWDRMGMIGDTTSEYDGVSATAVQSSSAFSAAIDRGTGGVEGVGIMEVCRGYHVYHARGVRYACLFGIGLEKRNLGIISKGCTGI